MASLPPICDPHFHFWDTETRPNPNLGGPAIAKYLPGDYKEDMAGMEVLCGVHVEAIVGQEPGGHELDAVDETRWVESLEGGMPRSLVVYAHLAHDDVDEVLAAHKAASTRVVGVRQILNHHPTDPSRTWPQVETGDWFTMPAFRAGFAKLKDHGLSFDLQCNPHQLEPAATFLADFLDTPVIVNHLGCLTLGDDEAIADWRRGMTALSKLPQVYVKLSFGARLAPKWWLEPDKAAELKAIILETVDLFGSARCMFASNFPVDKLFGLSASDLYRGQFDMVKHLPEADVANLFFATAAKVYRLE